MTKAERIQEVIKYSADLVWELDEQQYYMVIGCNYADGMESYWLENALSKVTVPFLDELLSKLKAEELTLN